MRVQPWGPAPDKYADECSARYNKENKLMPRRGASTPTGLYPDWRAANGS